MRKYRRWINRLRRRAWVNLVGGLDVGKQCTDEADIVDVMVDRITATAAAVPGQELISEQPGTVWINDDEMFFSSARVLKPLMLIWLCAFALTSMKIKYKR